MSNLDSNDSFNQEPAVLNRMAQTQRNFGLSDTRSRIQNQKFSTGSQIEKNLESKFNSAAKEPPLAQNYIEENPKSPKTAQTPCHAKILPQDIHATQEEEDDYIFSLLKDDTLIQKDSENPPQMKSNSILKKFFPSFDEVPGSHKLQILENLFKGDDSVLLRRKHILENNEKFIQQLKENPKMKDLITAPGNIRLSYEDICKIL